MNEFVKNIIDTIDTDSAKIEYDIYALCEEEFQIYEWIEQEKLGYRNYYSWICTDTEVGIRVWYFNEEVVAISFKPYRKYNTDFYWKDKGTRDKVFIYIKSLIEAESDPCDTFDNMADIVSFAKQIDFKQFEKFNTK